MAQRKPYNLNTKYGRKKARDESYSNLSEDGKQSIELWGCLIVLIIAIIVLGIGFCTGNEKGAMKWMTK